MLFRSLIATDPATHSSSSISPLCRRHRGTANLSSAGIGDCYTARSDSKNSNLDTGDPGILFARHRGYPAGPGTDRCRLCGVVCPDWIERCSPGHFAPILSTVGGRQRTHPLFPGTLHHSGQPPLFRFALQSSSSRTALLQLATFPTTTIC